ncbi:uncharacterized protein LOC126738732, partial [Anthonomus grandis grandis]|uniref:uncharacterized protein LOC126738732 n=1 Tax=Anthonomus grandis grandis TaxID=2921223 RepID=UPI002165E2B7
LPVIVLSTDKKSTSDPLFWLRDVFDLQFDRIICSLECASPIVNEFTNIIYLSNWSGRDAKGIALCGVNSLFDNDFDFNCKGKTFKNVSLTAYYPDYIDADRELGYQDKKGRKLKTLQDYLDDRSTFVTLSMDDRLGIPYGAKVCIPELNKHFGHRIRLEVRDTSYDLLGQGYSRADICVRTEIDSYDISVNKQVTLVFV